MRLSLAAFRSGIGMKLALVGLLLLAPLFVTTVALIDDWRGDLGVAVGTRDGLEFVAGLRALIDPLTAHRGATTLALAHEPGAEQRAIGLEQKVDDLLTKMRATNRALGDRFGTDASLTRIAAEWARVERDWRSMSIDDDRAAHSAMAEAILSLNETVGTAAKFPLDPEAESNYLLDAVHLRLLSIANLTGWMRSQLAAAAVAGKLSGADRDRLVSAYERARSLMDLVDADLAKALGLKDPRIAPIADVYQRYQARAREFRTLTEAMLAAPKIAARPDYVMKIGGDAKSAAFDLYDSAHRTTLRVIDDRIKATYREVIGTLALSLTLTVLALSFAWRLRGQIVRQLSSARAAFVRMEDGDFDAPLVPETGDEAGDVVAALARMQHALKARIERDAVLAAVADYADSAVMITDAAGRITWLNAGFTRMTGRSADGALGRTPEDLLDRRAADPAACARIDAARAQGLGWREDLRCVAAGGREYFVHAEAQPLLDPRGATKGYILIETDVSERLRAAEALRAARDAAEAGSRAKSAFLANMSHEIRTPLNGVIGMTGLLLDTQLDAQQREFAEIARTSGEALLALINDILDFSKIEAGHLEFESLDFDAVALLESTVDAIVLRAVEKGVELLLDIDPLLPRFMRGDPTRVRQIALNLIGNAVKFTERGDVRIAVSAVERAGRSAVRIEVRDSGIGMTPEQVARLFTPFTQVDMSMTRRFGGTGLGLSITKRLIDAMGGTVEVESGLGTGSTFRVEIPFDRAVTQPAAPPAAELRGCHVLIVEDHAVNRRILEAQLSPLGLHVTLATSASAALETWQQLADSGSVPDVILLDHDLPDHDGLWFASQLRGKLGAAMPPVVLLTSLGGLVRAEAMENGCARVLTKPAKRDALIEALGAAVGAKLAVSAPAPAVERRSDLAGLRVLVAEDNAVNQKLVVRLLEKLGIVVTLANDGRQALDRLRAAPVDIVLMDCQMPELDGYEATRLIRAGEAGPAAIALPVIALTAHALAGDRDRCLIAGMSDYLTKPIEPATLRAMLERYALPGAASGPEPATAAQVRA